MSAVAVPPRPHPSVRSARVAPVRPRSAPTLTVTLDLPLGGPLTPRLARLVDLLGELVEAGEVRARPGHAGTGESGTRTAAGWTRPGAVPVPPGWADGTAPDADPAAPSGVPAADTLLILADSRVVRQGAREVPLTRIEFDLLLFLAEHPRKVFTRLQLLASVWGYEHAVARTVDVHVRRLRAKLGAGSPLVTTVHGVGYRLADEARIVVHRQH